MARNALDSCSPLSPLGLAQTRDADRYNKKGRRTLVQRPLIIQVSNRLEAELSRYEEVTAKNIVNAGIGVCLLLVASDDWRLLVEHVVHTKVEREVVRCVERQRQVKVINGFDVIDNKVCCIIIVIDVADVPPAKAGGHWAVKP